MCPIVSDSALPHYLAKSKGSIHEDEVNMWSQLFSPHEESVNNSSSFPPSEGFHNKTLKMKMHERIECSMPANDISLPSICKDILTKEQETESLGRKYVGKLNDVRDLGKKPEMIDSTTFLDNDETSNVSKLPTTQLHQDFENLELPMESSRIEMRVPPFSFCAGYELYEALGPFHKPNDCVWEAEKTGSDIAVEISEGMGSCSVLMEHSDMQLLEAVVAKASHKGDDTESEISRGTISSAGFSFDSSSFNSVACGVESLKGLSPTSSSRVSEHMERPRGAIKVNKKRARPGESSRPRPRDRQLIQDRIKELRELIPNGSKVISTTVLFLIKDFNVRVSFLCTSCMLQLYTTNMF